MTAPTPRIVVSPSTPTLDQPVRIRVEGVPADAPVIVRAGSHDTMGRPWAAHATFVADRQGVVDVAERAPVDGTYTGVDAMGLIWSMTVQSGRRAPAEHGLAPARVDLAAEAGGETVAETSFDRLRLPPAVRRAAVRSHGLHGTLFVPVEGGPHPGVLLLGGAEGGMHELDAALLAGHGYAVLALAYFGARGLPSGLVNVPLEYFGTALEFLRSRRQVAAERLAVMGGSRGGEAALLIGATYPEVGAVVSLVGSGVLTQGIGYEAGGLIDILEQSGPSWTHHGRPLPYVPYVVPDELRRQVATGEPVDLGLAFRACLEDSPAVAEATIPVERIRGAVLLVSAGDDRNWPCAALSEIAAERLAKAGHPHPVVHLTYPEAGHPIAPPPYGPATELVTPGPGVRFATGGTPQANAAARADWWTRMLSFLAEHL